MNNFSIGMFDSGLGGLTVMRQLLKSAPKEHYVYFGDTARLPYGEKSREAIIRYSQQNASFLLKKSVKLIVVACSTASSCALDGLQESLDVPVVGMIEPGVDSALSATVSGRIAVLGTKGTIRSEAYKKAILKRNGEAMVISQACPLFVPLVEEHFQDHLAARLIVKEYMKPLKDQKIDTILLGCTHYPLLKHLICEEMGEEVQVIDPAEACASRIVSILDMHALHASENKPEDREHHFFVSDDPIKFQKLGEVFLGSSIRSVSLGGICSV